jgi:hypothetical protein
MLLGELCPARVRTWPRVAVLLPLTAGAAPAGRPAFPPLLLCFGIRKKNVRSVVSVKKTMVVPMTSGPHLKEQYHIKFTDFPLFCKIYISYVVAPKIVQFVLLESL